MEYDQKVFTYLQRKLNRRRYRARPMELKILWISKAVGLTYKQTRCAIDRLVVEKKIEKWLAWSGKNCKKAFYRLPTEIKQPVDNV